MNKKQMSLVVICAVAVSLAVTAVTASPLITNTPLYTIRMEQLSNKMHFLPTLVNNFTYTAESGYNLNFDAPVEYCSTAEPLDHCTNYATTCDVTCEPTCPGTAPCTCGGYTCDQTSCQDTCGTGETCDPTSCDQDTCYVPTCITCLESCGGTCSKTCDTYYQTSYCCP